MKFSTGKAVGYGLLIWITGFIWGSIVFMTPSLNRVPPIPYISSNPAISFPILGFWVVLAFLLSRNFLSSIGEGAAGSDRSSGMVRLSSAGLKLGLIFSVINFLLDLVVLVFLLKAGPHYFSWITVWLAYLLLLAVPWLTGRSLQKAQP